MANMQQGFRGISFPFRIGVRGGVVMSSTSLLEVPHIIEAMQQILLTHPYERSMEFHFRSQVVENVFNVNGIDTQQLVAYQVKESLRELEDRVEVEDVVITEDKEKMYANITFKVLAYNSVYNATMEVGEVSGSNS